jgi:hypothetical protein
MLCMHRQQAMNVKPNQRLEPTAPVGLSCECVTHRARRLRRGVDMIDIANGCAKRTYKSDFWRNRCVNHHYFLICTQGKS